MKAFASGFFCSLWDAGKISIKNKTEKMEQEFRKSQKREKWKEVYS